MAWGANFNFSVWHVEVKGIPDAELVQDTYFQYINFRETESVRLCLKHFRQRKLFDAFKALQERTNIHLEDTLLTKLHNELVVRGNFKRAEELITEAAERGLLNDYINTYDYKPIWKRLGPTNPRQGNHHHYHSHQPQVDESPRQRGGHQMCIDTEGGYVYLIGGWDGSRDQADFWAYSIAEQKWILISLDTSLQGGPTGRSCHKICYSPQHKAIFLLGKYVDPRNRVNVDLSSDFWRFDIDQESPPYGRWTKISSNTAVMGGPELIYDHQMCLDPISQTLYVFGGRVVHLDENAQLYSGLYSYNILSNDWKLLRADGHPPPPQDGNTVLRSRIGHSMLYDDMTRSLVIFAGQMNKDYLSDFYVYDIEADRVIEVCKDYNKQGGPDAGFTQRATISSKGREIYVLSGLVKDRALGAETVKNSFWVFKLPGAIQMDAIKDVQIALANSKSTGSIGSLQTTMNQGRAHSENTEIPDRPGDSYRTEPYRRADNDDRQERLEARSGMRRISSRSGNSSAESLSTTPISGSDQSTRTMQTRSATFGRKMSLRSSSSQSSATSSVQQNRSGNDIPIINDAPNQGAPNSKEGAISNLIASIPSMSSNSSRGQSSHHSSTHRTASAALTEPVSLAYVLSDQGSWQKIFQNSNLEQGEQSEPEPVPRYAHQLVYDEVNEVQYLFGGNPGEQGSQSKRLDDFWELRLYRPKPDEIIRKARYLLRTQQFKELCMRPETSAITSTTVQPNTPDSVGISDTSDSPSPSTRIRRGHSKNRANGNSNGAGCGTKLIERGTREHHDQSFRALKFLQTELSSVVDQSNKAENEDFKTLLRGLLLGAFSHAAENVSIHSSQKSSLTGSSASHVGPHIPASQRSTVLLAPSPIASPALNSSQIMFSSFPMCGLSSDKKAFLASPGCDTQDTPGFNSNCHRMDSEDEDEDFPMDGSSSSRRPSFRNSRRRRSSQWAMEELDSNGTKIKSSNLNNNNNNNNTTHDMNGDGEIDEDGDTKLADDGLEMDEDEEMDIEDEIENDGAREFYRERTLLYERLLEFFADEVKQPKGDLTDLIKVG
ncbi:Muskelin 1, intracellular mediator containing kelch motif [Entomortierella beljakovae]|nr:Muskelin 1, intracellular mediator containing kelch motif [Entomortierella beljakovae]